MLVLGDTRKWNVLVAIVQDGRPLGVAATSHRLKIERPVSKAAVIELEIAVQRTRIHDVLPVPLARGRKVASGAHLDIGMAQNPLHDLGIAWPRHTLEFV